MQRRRLLVGGGLVIALVAGSGIAVAAVSDLVSPDPDCTAVEAPTVELAAELAEDCHHDVAAVDSYDPWAELVATPRGTVRQELSVGAVRTDITGDWKPVDPAVVVDAASGDLRVASPVYDIRLSRSAKDGFLTIADGKRSVSVHAPVEVGAPVVDGATVTWPLLNRAGRSIEGAQLTAEVHPDATGVTPVIQVDTPEAYEELQDAAGAKGVSFEVTGGDGLKVERSGSAPGFALVEAATGAPVFTGGQPLQWDSSGGVEPGATQDEAKAESHEAAGASPSPSVAPTETSPGSASGQADPGTTSDVVVPPMSAGDAVAPMAVEVTDDKTVVVSADKEMVHDPDTTWPVIIDPPISGIIRHEWTQIRSSGSSQYKTTSSQGVGFCDRSAEAACARDFKARLLWEYTGISILAKLSAADIVAASFSAYGTSSYNCAGYQLRAYLMSAGISSSTTWSNQPSTKLLLDTKNPSHRSGSCGAPGWVEWDASAGVKAVAGTTTSMTISLRAPTEDSMSSWRRYYLHSAKLSIEYNRAPTLSALKLMVNTTVETCESSLSAAPYVLSTTPKLSAIGRDADAQTIKMTFDVYDNTSNTLKWTTTTSAQASGATQTVTVAASKLVNGGTYRWRVRAADSDGKLSSYGGWCYFKVDTTRPPKPTVTPVIPAVGDTTIKAVYPPDGERGGVGLTGCFTFTSTATDVVSYTYAFGGTANTTVKPSSGTTATVCMPLGYPTNPGTNVLTVKSTDRSGQLSDPQTYRYEVAAAREDGVWSFDERVNPAPDQSRRDPGEAQPAGDLTISGATWATGPHTLFNSRPGDTALDFDGVDDDAVTDAPVFDTTKSFVVSAHVLLDEGTKWHTAIVQEAPIRNGWRVGFQPSGCPITNWTGGCWEFVMYDGQDSGPWRAVYSPVAPKIGQWTHLTAEYDQPENKVRLWVCDIGTPDAPAPGEPIMAEAPGPTKTWQAPGAVAVGRGWIAGAKKDFWDGKIDNIRLFKGEVVAAAKIRRMCQGAEANDFVAGGEDALDPTTMAGQ